MKASTKTIYKLFSKHKARLITIIAIVIVSIGFMAGIGEVEHTIKSGFNDYYYSQNVSDLYIKSSNTTGFSQEEISYINEIFDGNIQKSLCYEYTENDNIIRVHVRDLSNSNVNTLKLQEGNLPTTSKQVVVERATDTLKSYKVGDTINIKGIQYLVSGIAINPLYLLKSEETSYIDTDKNLDYIFYINQAPPIVNDIYVRFSAEERAVFNEFSDEYKLKVESYKTILQNNLQNDSIIVLSLYENAGIMSLIGYAEKVGQISLVFVVFFLLVTLLVVYSTMSRLLEEERSHIACQKTLGFSDNSIVFKYTFFVMLATIIGGALSFPVGHLLTKILYKAFNMLFAMPPYPSIFSGQFFAVTFVLIFLATTLLTIISSKKMIDNKPVVLLSPKATKNGRKIILEKIPFVWNRLSFKYKSTFRNVLLFRSRFYMTVISVLGSSILVLAGMGLFDCALKDNNAGAIIAISIVVIIFSALLCALVIYNLTNINVSERNREIATLMVLGYKEKEITGYIYREIYIMSFIGAILGLPIGTLFLDFVFNFINYGQIAGINWWTWILTPLLTIFFAFLSTLLLKKKILKTNMNDSLKTLE